MALHDAHDPRVLRSYEGLVFCTAQRALRCGVEEEFEDIQQLYRVAVFKALEAFTPPSPELCLLPRRCRCRRCRFVFSCVKNREKDVLKKRRRGELFIEDVAPSGGSDGRDEFQFGWGKHSDPFEARYLSTTHEEVYGAIEEDNVLVPNTLDRLEVEIVVLLYRDYRQSEIARNLGLEKREMERAMRSIRAKMADWRPGSGSDARALLPPPVPAVAA